jgi:hypothetical protein
MIRMNFSKREMQFFTMPGNSLEGKNYQCLVANAPGFVRNCSTVSSQICEAASWVLRKFANKLRRRGGEGRELVWRNGCFARLKRFVSYTRKS